MNKYVWFVLVGLGAALAAVGSQLPNPWDIVATAIVAALAAIGIPSAMHVGQQGPPNA